MNFLDHCFFDQCLLCFLVSVTGYAKGMSLGKRGKRCWQKSDKVAVVGFSQKKVIPFTQKIFCAHFSCQAIFAPLYIMRPW